MKLIVGLLVILIAQTATILWLVFVPPTIEESILQGAPCVVRAIGSGGSEEGLDQLVVNAEAAGLRVARTDDYVAVVQVDCDSAD